MLALIVQAGLAQAQASGSAARSTTAPIEAPSACCVVPALTEVSIEIVDPVNSRSSQRGDRFAIRLSVPLVVEGRTVLPAGNPGVGEVVHAARARMGGKAGELILAARYLEHDGRQIPLRRFRFGGTGVDRSTAAVVTSIVVPVAGLFIAGGEVDIPAGTVASAILTADTLIVPADGTPGEPIAPTTPPQTAIDQ
ncbi:MAG: hypothetical protein H7X93_06715 [Sphingomonadaceae bacterium]|nr:hypothetical protein [Sphingomonadaceae bacterium]